MQVIANFDTSVDRVLSVIKGYGLAVLLVFCALFGTLLLQPPALVTPLFFPAVILSAWFGGMGPGLLAVVLSSLAVEYFLLEPIKELNFGLSDVPYLLAFTLSALFVSWLSAARRRAGDLLQHAYGEMEAKVQERTVELSRTNQKLEAEIAERERIETELRAQASLLNLTHDTVFVRDMHDVITYWNRGAEELYGWKKEEAVGKVTHQLMLTTFPVLLEQINEELFHRGRWEGELLHTRRDGTQVVVASRWSLQRDLQGQPTAILETNNNVTERKQAEEAVQRQANLLEQTHDAILVWSLPGTITYWNRGAERLYGFSREEAIGRHSHDLLRTEHPIPVTNFEAALKRNGAWMGELTHVTRDGRKIMVESRHVLLTETDGRQLVLETNNDITERKHAESELLRLQLEMGRVERLAAFGKMASAIAHELGTPLNSVLGYTQLLSGDDLPERARHRLTIIETQIQRMVEIIQHYLSHSRGSAARTRINVNDLIRETLVLLQPILQEREIEVVAALAEAPPPFFGDGVSLQRVLINLIDNAVEASRGKGRIDIKTLVNSSPADKTRGIIIEIADNGAGISPEILPKIFDLFVTTKPPGKGTGLGLAICQEIIKAHRGTINVLSQVGEGTSVEVFLPTEANAMESVMEKRA
jgi:PAS domain S-box-containing protein